MLQWEKGVFRQTIQQEGQLLVNFFSFEDIGLEFVHELVTIGVADLYLQDEFWNSCRFPDNLDLLP